MENDKKVIYEISVLSVFKVILLLIALWLLYLIRDVLIILLVVGIISIALEPFVVKLEKDRIPRALSVIVLYVALLVLLGLAFYFIIPPVATQIRELALNLPYYSTRISEVNFGNIAPISSVLDSISSNLSGIAGGVFGTLVSVFGGIAYAIIIFALTFYALVDSEGIRRSLATLIPYGHKNKLQETITKISNKLGDWLRGQLVLMLIVGVLDGSILAILGIKYALTLGLLSGLLEIVPVIGPIISALTAVLVAFISGEPLWKVAVILLAYIVVQQLENNILVPKIMQKAIGLSPLLVIIAILIGHRLLGLGGAILAVPVAAGIQVVLEEYSPFKQKQAE
ncbi:AI-2E family transporter [Patescibacteria group bacterium]|nr:AI-2E family transporter [Patescibacteria group bacterium]